MKALSSSKSVKREKKIKWRCDDCNEDFKFKKDLVDHLRGEFEEGSHQAETAQNQCDELGVNPYG